MISFWMDFFGMMERVFGFHMLNRTCWTENNVWKIN